MWDDDISIYNNPKMGGLTLERLVWMFTDVDTMMRYYPLTQLSLSVTYEFFGLNPLGYHLGNWLLHGMNGVLFFFLLMELLRAGIVEKDRWYRVHKWGTLVAALTALLWSVHPLRVETVAWANERSYEQAAFFILLSLLFYLKANRSESTSWHRRLFFDASIIGFLASILSHPIAISAFLVYLVLDIYPLRRIGGDVGWWTRPAQRVLFEKVLYFAVAACVTVVTVMARLYPSGIWPKSVSLKEFGILDRLAQAGYICFYYLWKPWYPVNLSPVYTDLVAFDPVSAKFLLSAAAVVTVTILVFLFRRRWPIFFYVWLCHLLLLVPVLGFFEHPHYPADRYSIFSSMLWSVLLAAGFIHLCVSYRQRLAVLCSLIVLVALLSSASLTQTWVWRDSAALFEHMISVLGNDPYRHDIYRRLGYYHLQGGRISEAEAAFKQGLIIAPYVPYYHNLLGLALYAKGEFAAASREFAEAIRLDPNNTHFRYNQAVALAKSGSVNDAIKQLQLAITIDPSFTAAHTMLNALIVKGR